MYKPPTKITKILAHIMVTIPQKRSNQASWQDIAKEAQEYRDASIARVRPLVPDVPTELPDSVAHFPRELLSHEEIQITETSPEDLVTALAFGDLSSVTVVKAFLRRAGLAQKLVNITLPC